MSRKKANEISRREFIKLAGAAAAGAVLVGAGCESKPAAPKLSNQSSNREEIIKHAPNAISKVVQTHHSGAWSGADLVQNVLEKMLDASITRLTGLNDASEAWKVLFDPREKVAIKTNAIYTGYTHSALVMAVTEKLKATGLPPEQILIFDRQTKELNQAGLSINYDGKGIRCMGTDGKYTGRWKMTGKDIRFSNLLLGCDALINMPILKTAGEVGITFAMKNHYGSFDIPQEFHTDFKHSLPELNAQGPIMDKTRLIIGDLLTPSARPDPTGYTILGSGDSILMSFDCVALDAAGMAFAEKLDPGSPYIKFQSNKWLDTATEMGIGTNQATRIDFIEQNIN